MALQLIQQQIRADIGHSFEGWQLQEVLLEDWGQWALDISMQDLEYAAYLIKRTQWKTLSGPVRNAASPGKGAQCHLLEALSTIPGG